MVHVVVILSTISVESLTEEWFMLLLLYCISLLFKHDRVVVHVVVLLSTITD